VSHSAAFGGEVDISKDREEGECVFEDRRGNPFRESTEEYRYIRRLEMENAVLKKWLAILNQEVCKKNGRSSKL